MKFVLKNKINSILIVYLLLLPSTVLAAKVEFLDFNLSGNNAKYQVQTRVNFELTNYLHKALLNGVTLNAHVQIRLGKYRSWWFNQETPLITVLYQLKYHALSRHFLLSRNDTNEHWNFSTLPSTLRKLSELKKYNLPKIKAPLDNGGYYIFAIADITPASLRLPLRVQSLFTDQYKLTSEGVLWPLP